MTSWTNIEPFRRNRFFVLKGLTGPALFVSSWLVLGFLIGIQMGRYELNPPFVSAFFIVAGLGLICSYIVIRFLTQKCSVLILESGIYGLDFYGYSCFIKYRDVIELRPAVRENRWSAVALPPDTRFIVSIKDCHHQSVFVDFRVYEAPLAAMRYVIERVPCDSTEISIVKHVNSAAGQ